MIPLNRSMLLIELHQSRCCWRDLSASMTILDLMFFLFCPLLSNRVLDIAAQRMQRMEFVFMRFSLKSTSDNRVPAENIRPFGMAGKAKLY